MTEEYLNGSGIVYILKNEAMPGLVKIGKLLIFDRGLAPLMAAVYRFRLSVITQGV